MHCNKQKGLGGSSSCSRRVGRWGIPSYSSKKSVSQPNKLRDFKFTMAPKNSSAAALEGKISRMKKEVLDSNNFN